MLPIILYITAYVLLVYPLINSVITTQKGIEHKDEKEIAFGIFLFAVTLIIYMVVTMYLLIDTTVF
ncbi:hypothetical protein SOJ_17690 [Staphylococcus sp. OJ82]|nr:hypothetical protein SOJ_17690 [Staphylococcus sp. OJ82]CCI60663.1 putative uncharacterized protein [Staphylococcus equorum subsp. equorum Mu2]